MSEKKYFQIRGGVYCLLIKDGKIFLIRRANMVGLTANLQFQRDTWKQVKIRGKEPLAKLPKKRVLKLCQNG